MRIGIAGAPGSGTTTLALRLAGRFGLSVYSAGSAYRAGAKERGITLSEFCKLAENDTSIDREIDKRQERFARANDNIIIESRLAGLVMDNADLLILLTAPLCVRAERVARRDGITPEEALEQTRAREDFERRQYRTLYGIDITSIAPYHMVLDTERLSADAVFEVVSRTVDTARHTSSI